MYYISIYPFYRRWFKCICSQYITLRVKFHWECFVFFLWKNSIWTFFWVDPSTANGIGVNHQVLTDVFSLFTHIQSSLFYTSILHRCMCWARDCAERPWVLAFNFSYQQWWNKGQGVTVAFAVWLQGQNAHVHMHRCIKWKIFNSMEKDVSWNQLCKAKEILH